MADASKIQWTDSTFNPWWGCTKVSPGCTNCYAETLANRFEKGVWGPAPRFARKPMSEAYWRKPMSWSRKAEAEGRRHRVFCASMADVFDDHPDVVEHRDRLFNLIESTPHLDWQLLTKRPENVMGMVPGAWVDGFPQNVWMGTSVEDQERADERIPQLLRIPAAVRFLSCEPLLGPVRLRGYLMQGTTPGKCANCGHGHGFTRCPNYGGVAPTWSPRKNDPPTCTDFRRAEFAVAWIIIGGESGPGARPCNVEWIRDIVGQCRDAGVPAFAKQLGARPFSNTIRWVDPQRLSLGTIHDPKGGDPSEWPADLRVREFPGVSHV